jgi:putative hemolysin
MGVAVMGRTEALGLVVLVAGALGTQAADRPAEASQIETTKEIIGMSRAEFESWCAERGELAEAAQSSSNERKATCAWVDGATGEAWHAALHFHALNSQPHQADMGLVDASNDKVLRLIHNAHGTSDGQSVEGFPVWAVDIDDREALLAVAEYEEITLVQLKL